MATIEITGERLAAMYDNDMSLYVTPGAENRPYWSNHPNFIYDYCALTVTEIMEVLEIGDIADLRDDHSVYTIELP